MAKPGFDLQYLVKGLIKYNASDLHVAADRPPLYRINGKLVPAKMAPISEEILNALIKEVLSARQLEDLETKKQIDLSLYFPELGRFRCNVYYQRGGLCAAIRLIPTAVPQLDQIGVPAVLKELCQRKRGLLLVTGSTGNGKSTTLASMVQYINETSHVHILTIEDPIEFVYRDLKAFITQREVGQDTVTMGSALVGGLRQDPDVIVIGEMRDAQTIQTALAAAETGHLVISTLHTTDAKSSIERMIDVFQGENQNQIRMGLATNLIGVVTQRLVLRADGGGRVPAVEVMIKSPAIETYILKNELEKIPEAISSSNTYYKMQSMNQALEVLVKAGTITVEEALKASTSPDDLKLMLSGLQRGEGYRITSS